jgi:hypothetical protein
MSTFGKALIGVNVVLAFAFVFLAATDYSRRRGWENLILQQDLTINGLAIDEDEKDAEGQLIYQLAGKNMQQQLGVTTSTQVEELRKRHDQIKSAIDGAADGAAKKAEVVKYVLPLARNTVEYYLIATGNDAEFAAQSPLMTKVMGQDGPFESAFGAGNKPAKSNAYDVRREVIAFFLFNTSVEPADYQRTLGVVGLAAYARALEGQTVRLANMVPEVAHDIGGDRTAFLANHRALVEQIVDLDRKLRGLQELLAKHEEQLSHYQTLRAARAQDVQDLTKRIAETKAAAEKALAVQTDLEKQLFATDKQVADVKQKNEGLDREIKTKELGH